jgi:translation initiation factor IF-2
MNKFNGNLEKLLKAAGKKKAAIKIVEELYNAGSTSIVIKNLREVDAGCRLESDYPESFYCTRKDYSNDWVFGLKG